MESLTLVRTPIQTTHDVVLAALSDAVLSARVALGELTVWVSASGYHAACQALRDTPDCRFEQLIDLCGLDYLDYPQGSVDGKRYCVVLHLLSVSNNQRMRLKVSAPDDDAPILPTVTDIWSGANWFEREAFDLYGVVFEGHEDLRRILTDYGFVGHPLRKDFPMSGHVEMRYDPEQKRVIYQPVTIEPREITPRVVREDHYAGLCAPE